MTSTQQRIHCVDVVESLAHLPFPLLKMAATYSKRCFTNPIREMEIQSSTIGEVLRKDSYLPPTFISPQRSRSYDALRLVLKRSNRVQLPHGTASTICSALMLTRFSKMRAQPTGSQIYIFSLIRNSVQHYLANLSL